jgi:hypothetical protein
LTKEKVKIQGPAPRASNLLPGAMNERKYSSLTAMEIVDYLGMHYVGVSLAITKHERKEEK